MELFQVMYNDRIGWTVDDINVDLISFDWIGDDNDDLSQPLTLFHLIANVNESFMFPTVGSTQVFRRRIDALTMRSSVAIMLEPSLFNFN